MSYTIRIYPHFMQKSPFLLDFFLIKAEIKLTIAIMNKIIAAKNKIIIDILLKKQADIFLEYPPKFTNIVQQFLRRPVR